MTHTSHTQGAIICTLGISELLANSTYTYPSYGALIMGITCLIGASIPDADTKNSYISHRFGLLLLPLRIGQALIKLISILPGPFKKLRVELRKQTGHRGILHYPITWLLLNIVPGSILLARFLVTKKFDMVLLAYLGVLIGIASHLILDAFFGGVALLFPLRRKRIYLSPFKTRGVVEHILQPIMTFTIIYQVKNYIENILS